MSEYVDLSNSTRLTAIVLQLAVMTDDRPAGLTGSFVNDDNKRRRRPVWFQWQRPPRWPKDRWNDKLVIVVHILYFKTHKTENRWPRRTNSPLVRVYVEMTPQCEYRGLSALAKVVIISGDLSCVLLQP